MNAVALIPARAGSKRVPDKNIRRLGAHPVLAYAIASARESGVFEAIVVSTDSEQYAQIAKHYGAEAPFLRPAAFAGDRSPDIEWVVHALEQLLLAGRRFDCFSILRPTSPFRSAGMIRRAWAQWTNDGTADSLRAVELCSQHPYKMWVVSGDRMTPLIAAVDPKLPGHSRQYADLPTVYVQNASLEIAKTSVALDGGTIAGDVVMPFMTHGHEGLDINQPRDWEYAVGLVASGAVMLPQVDRSPFEDT